MINNNNMSIIQKISKKSFRANRNRNIVAIIAIILTTILFTTLFTMSIGLLNTVKKENIRKAGGDGQVVLSNITDSVYNEVKDSSLIDKISYTKLAADEILEEKLDYWRTELWYMDETAISFAGYDLVEGSFNRSRNEIIMDSKTLELLGYEAKVGEIIHLKYRVKDQVMEEDFILSGYWNTEYFSSVGKILVSEEYIEENKEELIDTYDQDLNYSGMVAAYINFKNSSDLAGEITKLLNSAGYVWDGTTTDKNADNYVIARINPAYQSTLSLDDPSIMFALTGAVLLIFITGYLIIYNIFQISVIQDIRFFGQLKTLGTTQRQIGGLMRKQVYKLSAIGIPIGLITGYLLGIFLVPVLMKSTNYNVSDGINLALIPVIFAGAALFAFVTLCFSVRKPGKIAAGVSPLEALKYIIDSESKKKRKRVKQSLNGSKLYRMAIANLGRDKKRTVLVILSLSLSTVLLNTVFTLTNGFDEVKYIQRFVDKDFIISTADYFNYEFTSSEIELSEEFIQYVNRQSAFAEGGRLTTVKILEEDFYAESKELDSVNRDENGWPMIQLYGVDDFLLKEMKVLEGEVDSLELREGRGIILGLSDDGTGRAESVSPLHAGDKLTIHYKGTNGKTGTYEMKVEAIVLLNGNTYTSRHTGMPDLYVPTAVFNELTENPVTVSYPFNCRQGDGNVERMQEKLEQYVAANSSMSFESRQTFIEAFDGIKNTFIMIGGAMGCIIAFIGIVNFLNAMLTSTITRKKEFAMMQGVGMTDKQLRNMLCMEGVGYAFTTILVSLVLSIMVSFAVVRVVSANIWFFTFRFTLLPVMIISPIFIIITFLVPYFLCKSISKESIIERLRTE